MRPGKGRGLVFTKGREWFGSIFGENSGDYRLLGDRGRGREGMVGQV